MTNETCSPPQVSNPVRVVPSQCACYEHFDLSLSDAEAADSPRACGARKAPTFRPGPPGGRRFAATRAADGKDPTNSTTSFSTATNLMFLRRAGITAAAGTRLALDLIVSSRFTGGSFCAHPKAGLEEPRVGFPVTASLKEHWAIFVTAAAHRSNSRLSGCFSGASPKTPVIHDRQGCPIHYRRNLMEKNHDRLGSRKKGHAGCCDSPRPLAGGWSGQHEQSASQLGQLIVVLAVGYKRYPLRFSQSGSLVIYYGAIHQDPRARRGLETCMS